MQIKKSSSAGVGWIFVSVIAGTWLPAQRAANADEPVGQASFMRNCASCHGRNLDNGEFAPAVKGQSFLKSWGGRPVSEFAAYLRANMPPGQSGELSKDEYAALVTFILNANGAPSDAASLPAGSAAPTATRTPGAPANEQAS